jgi:cytoskeletal protein RodZ
MTFRWEISWVLLVKLIAITAIWYIWFSGPRQEVDPLHLVIPPSASVEQTTPSISTASEVSQ